MKKAFYLILAGVAIGILVAPDKGSETWKKLKDGFDDWKNQAMDQINDVVDKGKDLVAKSQSVADETVSSAPRPANEW